MKNLEKTEFLKSISSVTDFGVLTTLVAETAISTKDSMCFEGKTLLASYVYAENSTYKLVYTLIDRDGKQESFVEDDGVLPTLFLSPDGRAFVSIVPYHPDKDLEISIPVFGRESTDLPKGNRPFTGDYIGTAGQFSIFYDVDFWSNTKPDKLLAIEFKDGNIKKKHTVKIPTPRNNKVFIADDEIHLLAKIQEGWLHRQIDESGKIIRERRIKPSHEFFWQILSLSFERDSSILCKQDGRIFVETISEKGECESNELINMQESFNSSWQPVRIAEDTFVIRFGMLFDGKTGNNGWFTIKNNQLLELFYSKDVNGYRNILTNEIIQMDRENLIISNLSKTIDNGYAVVFYPMTSREAKSKEVIILNRKL